MRIFPKSVAFPGQKDSTVSPALAAEPELVLEWDDERLTLAPFVRLDADDNRRSHADLREANWLHLDQDWELLVGLSEVFWGVTESRHLVNIINQTDTVEDIDEEDKLGQPMIHLVLQRDWGALGFYVLPVFRERTFAGNDARLRGPLPIDDDDPSYDSGAEEFHPDAALRWSHAWGDWDLGLGHFLGTSREPRLRLGAAGGRAVLVPHYDQIDQTGADLQYTTGAWLFKLEAITRGGHGDRFQAAVGGFEYTRFGLFESTADLGFLAEYLYDGRDNDDAPPTFADDDLFFGGRVTLNDEQDTAVLVGAIVDRVDKGTLLFIEAERRLGESWKLEIESRWFLNVADDDFLTLRLSWFF